MAKYTIEDIREVIDKQEKITMVEAQDLIDSLRDFSEEDRRELADLVMSKGLVTDEDMLVIQKANEAYREALEHFAARSKNDEPLMVGIGDDSTVRTITDMVWSEAVVNLGERFTTDSRVAFNFAFVVGFNMGAFYTQERLGE